jgi:putative addiction module component (TIGR02574 family)
MTKEQIIENVRQLPRQDQLDLACELLEIVDPAPLDGPLSDELKAELDRRMAEADAEKAPPEDLETLKAKLLRGEF